LFIPEYRLRSSVFPNRTNVAAVAGYDVKRLRR
jgi:hypothetical protein